MKKYFLILFLSMLFINVKSQGSVDEGIKLSGNWRYNIDFSQKTVRVTGDKIINKSVGGKSGTIKIRLYLTDTKYSGGNISGYVLCDYTFNQLDGGYYYDNINKLLNFYSIPSDGTYYMTLCLLEYSNDYYIKDYLNFNDQIAIDYSAERMNNVTNAINEFGNALNSIGNTINNSNSNGRESNNYQSQYDIWVNNARSNYTTLYNAKDRSSSAINNALIIQTRRYLSQAQSNMRRIRTEAASNGVTIRPSEYESISY